jgi:hypothetical protein
MAGNGPIPKPAGQRRRRNLAPAGRTLRQHDAPPAPKLPFKVSKPTADWWTSIWGSPMSGEWDASDQHGLFMLARLLDDFWTTDDPATRAKLSTEIRLQGQRYGLSPIDRKRLAWETPKAPSPASNPAPRKPAKPDPRLRAVK